MSYFPGGGGHPLTYNVDDDHAVFAVCVDVYSVPSPLCKLFHLSFVYPRLSHLDIFQSTLENV